MCGGDLRQLLFAFFNFLHRRTDFYMVPHADDVKKGSSRKMGFKEGDAERLMIAAFRQFPLRRMPPQDRQQEEGGDANDNAEKPPKKDPPGERKYSVKKDPPAKPNNNQAQSKEKEKQTNNPKQARKAKENDEEIRFTDEGKQVPVGNGGATSKYRWTQTLEEATVVLPIPPNTRGKDLAVKIKAKSLSVRLKSDVDGEPLVEGDLSEAIQTDESTWSLEGEALLLILQKVKKTWWENVLEKDDKIDTTLVDSRRHIESYDESTQGAIRKILFDQRQQRLGLPTSDQILRQAGADPIPPLPPGVEYIDKATLDKHQE